MAEHGSASGQASAVHLQPTDKGHSFEDSNEDAWKVKTDCLGEVKKVIYVKWKTKQKTLIEEVISDFISFNTYNATSTLQTQ